MAITRTWVKFVGTGHTVPPDGYITDHRDDGSVLFTFVSSEQENARLVDYVVARLKGLRVMLSEENLSSNRDTAEYQREQVRYYMNSYGVYATDDWSIVPDDDVEIAHRLAQAGLLEYRRTWGGQAEARAAR